MSGKKPLLLLKLGMSGTVSATLSDSHWDDMDNDDHFRLWTVSGCKDGTYHLKGLMMQLVSNRTPFELGSLEFLHWQLAIENGTQVEEDFLEELQYAVTCFLGFHGRIHRVQHALHQLVGDDSTEWFHADRVGCQITKYVAIIKDLLNHMYGGTVNIFDYWVNDLLLCNSEPH
ncbi:hypothetical protein CONPUDRAFT_74629 [Coniophora puteana RWD-64-598 SS2]|uniref:Uncharacterized protein n=1 Tax=Coniophora puteana (strain RWD-64-598) TaxID=741705 RepID=A0A5M3MJY0_CONPW|nr:uncharacterized protein CONPUDRAFT_74629 [Coniophora puteana RWD-64-598 SS2]EIW79114.1 hypothetical protein CONPUDRAFT_74629 [Coniophora puteana RWD-64-598 SS2]